MMFSLAGMPWLEKATRPDAATTDVSPTSNGIIEPTSAPSTIMRMMIVSGIEIMPALARPPWISLSSAFSVETPMLSKVRPGCRASVVSTAATILSM